MAAVTAAAAMMAAAIVVVTGGGHDTKAEAAVKLPVGQIAHRVEKLRELKFRYVPKVSIVAAKDLRKDVESGQPKATRKLRQQALAASGVTALTGIVAGQAGSGSGGGGSGDIEGVYVGKRKRIYLVREAVEKAGDNAQAILAHELTHALEDQHFHDYRSQGTPFSDSSTAKQALDEGSATLVELRYEQRYLHARGDLSQLLAKRQKDFTSGKGTPALLDLAAFPYIAGGAFVESLHKRGGWKLVNVAHRRPPRTSEAILHPQAWHGTDSQKRPRFDADGALGKGWERLGRSDIGEVDTLALLRVGVSEADARRGASGWEAGAFETWQKRGANLEKCKLPCRTEVASVLDWRWDSPKEAKEFDEIARQSLVKGLNGSARTGGVIALTGGAAVLKLFGGRRTALAYAPTAAQARTLVKAASNG